MIQQNTKIKHIYNVVSMSLFYALIEHRFKVPKKKKDPSNLTKMR